MLTISTAATKLLAGSLEKINFNFGADPGSSFTQSDITVSGGTLEPLVKVAGTNSYYAMFRPTPNLDAGFATISVASGAWASGVKQGGGATMTAVPIDTSIPTATLTSNITNNKLLHGQSLALTLTFSEAPAAFDNSYVEVILSPNRSALSTTRVYNSTATSVSGSGLSRTITFTPPANLEANGNVEIHIANSAGASKGLEGWTDVAGNPGTTTGFFNVQIDQVLPTVSISGVPALVAGRNQSRTFTFNLSESPVNVAGVNTFTLDDIEVVGGQLAALTAVSGSANKQYTATFTPSANYSGPASVTVKGQSFNDFLGNLNSGATTTNFSVDTAGPSVVMTLDPSNPSILSAANPSARLIFTFSEDPYNTNPLNVVPSASSSFIATDIALTTGGTLSLSARDPANPLVYTATFTATSGTAVTKVSVGGAAGDQFTDIYGNYGSYSAAMLLDMDMKPPSVSITSNKGVTRFIAGDTAELCFDFGEVVSGFAWNGSSGDLVVSNGTVGALYTKSGEPNKAYAVFTPAVNFVGNASVSVVAGSYLDAVGNAGLAGVWNPFASNWWGGQPLYSVDTAPPVVSFSAPTLMVQDPANGLFSPGTVAAPTLKAGQSANFVLNFSDPVDLISTTNNQTYYWKRGGILASAGTVSADAGSGSTANVAFKPPVGVDNGSAVITVPAGVFKDHSGNPVAGPVVSSTIYFDTLGPTVAVSADNTWIKPGATSNLTFTFSEDVGTSFSVSDLSGLFGQSLGGTLGTLVRDANNSRVYTSVYTANSNSGQNEYGVYFKAGTPSSPTFTDVAGNPGTAGGGNLGVKIVVDAERPTPTITSSLGTTKIGPGVEATYTIRFFEDVTGFDVSDVVLSAGVTKGLFTAVSAKLYTLVVSAPQFSAGSFTVNVAANAATDLAGNLSQAAYQSSAVYDTRVPVNLSAIAAGSGGFVINGGSAGDWSGLSVAGAGDVNGDGLADLIVGAPAGDPLAGADAGLSFVVFGTTASTAINLSAVAGGVGGFVINGQAASDASGQSVSAAGDVNGDGLADLVVGARFSDSAAGTDAGRSYVVFGRTASSTVDLSAVAAGSGGFVINGQCAGDQTGLSVSGAGDVNGDGLADLLVAAPGDGTGLARVYLVHGTGQSAAIDLSAVAAGTGGFVINGQSAGDFGGFSVSGVGDVNGDGLADLLIGAPSGDHNAGGNARTDAGRSYLVFGKTGGTAVQLTALESSVVNWNNIPGSGGFVINGDGSSDRSGHSVAAAGDVNGDGLADLLIGAPYSDPGTTPRVDAGRSYVVFGKTLAMAVTLTGLSGATGFAIEGASAGDRSGFSVSGAGDINGDGLADLIIGAPGSDPLAGADAGRSYVVFGQSIGGTISLSAVATGSGGFVINGQGASDGSGVSVSAAGDVNGDGLPDLLVGASLSDPASGTDAGRSYLIFGSTTGAFAQTAVDQYGGTGDDSLSGSSVAETLLGNRGQDTLVGGGGADVLYGGAGDDRLVLNASNLTALAAGVAAGPQRARVDGGSGFDTLALDGATLTLDLRSIANPGALSSRIASIEAIALQGSGDNTALISLADVQDMAGQNWLNAGNAASLGWSSGSYSFPASHNWHQLVVEGDAGDSLRLYTPGWAPAGSVTRGATGYTVYNNASGRAQVLVANAVAVQTQSLPIELSAVAAGGGGFVINGQSAGDQSGVSVASAGDVNGDGLDDLIIGANLSDPVAGLSAGRSYVVFGRADMAAINLSDVAGATGGFVINGQGASDQSGLSVSGAGDVNGDGLVDLIVGALGSDPAAGTNAGRSYVVFGKASSTAVELSAVAAGTGGFVINGQCASDWSGYSVASAGDVNGDGLADLIVGAKLQQIPRVAPMPDVSYVVFGNAAAAQRSS